jgi:hypothetical protein
MWLGGYPVMVMVFEGGPIRAFSFARFDYLVGVV